MDGLDVMGGVEDRVLYGMVLCYMHQGMYVDNGGWKWGYTWKLRPSFQS